MPAARKSLTGGSPKPMRRSEVVAMLIVVMSTAVIASILVGAILALRFNVFILMPTIIAAWAVLAGIGFVWEMTLSRIALEMAVVTTALQIGYLTCLLEGLAIRPS